MKKKVIKKAKKKDQMGVRFDMTCYKQHKSCTEKDLDNLLDGFIKYIESKGMFCCGTNTLVKIN
jgi:hypothetical protein